MKYRITKEYEVKEITCGEAVKMRNEENNVYRLTEFIDPEFPDEVITFHNSWDWVQARSKDKKLLLVIEETKSEGRMVGWYETL